MGWSLPAWREEEEDKGGEEEPYSLPHSTASIHSLLCMGDRELCKTSK